MPGARLDGETLVPQQPIDGGKLAQAALDAHEVYERRLDRRPSGQVRRHVGQAGRRQGRAGVAHLPAPGARATQRQPGSVRRPRRPRVARSGSRRARHLDDARRARRGPMPADELAQLCSRRCATRRDSSSGCSTSCSTSPGSTRRRSRSSGAPSRSWSAPRTTRRVGRRRARQRGTARHSGRPRGDARPGGVRPASSPTWSRTRSGTAQHRYGCTPTSSTATSG